MPRGGDDGSTQARYGCSHTFLSDRKDKNSPSLYSSQVLPPYPQSIRLRRGPTSVVYQCKCLKKLKKWFKIKKWKMTKLNNFISF